jgi:hypothetical protein
MRRILHPSLTLAFALLLLPTGACAPVPPNGTGVDAALDRDDNDGDGFSEAQGDCDDQNPQIHPLATEVVDGRDNNCDGKVDADLDGDGWATYEGDCDDTRATVNPMAKEVCDDGLDNNCNSYVDANEPDRDGDGYAPCASVRRDCNDNNPDISPGAMEAMGDGIDNNCDGLIDLPANCDCLGEEPGATLEQRLLSALDFCNLAIVDEVVIEGNPAAFAAPASWGAIEPRLTAGGEDGLPTQNCKFAVLSSGQALSPEPQGGMESDLGIYDVLDPAPGTSDNAEINDLGQLRLSFTVPVNVTGLSFDFVFLSTEYPEYVCSEFNDTFYALLQGEPLVNGSAYTNISFDNSGNEITVNNGFFETAPNWTMALTGTGYETADTWASCGLMGGIPGCTIPNPCPGYTGSMTGWLRTTTPLTPGSSVTLTFSIHDEGDNILDSAVVVDNFRWQTIPIDGPGTVK